MMPLDKADLLVVCAWCRAVLTPLAPEPEPQVAASVPVARPRRLVTHSICEACLGIELRHLDEVVRARRQRPA